jgi:hypothetical protein
MKLGTSQNGWAVYDDTTHFTRVKVAGVGFWAANADVATVLADFTQRYNDTIESITLPVKEAPGYDDWSYAVRPVRGQTKGYSNHASATAWDLNATRHPRGVDGTYPGDLRPKLKALVARYNGVLRDGEFYTTSTIDGMHIEINAGPDAVKAEADRIRSKEDDMSKADAVAALKDPSLVRNLDAEDKETGRNSVVRFQELADQKLDFIKASVKGLTRSLTAANASLATLNAALAALAKNSPEDVRAAFTEGVAKLKSELADIDVQVSLGTKEEPSP